MARALALFPLQLVAYPGESVNLHLFEPRYRELLVDMEREGTTFAIPTVIDEKLRPVATEVRLEGVTRRYPSGESDVTLRGINIVFVEKFFSELPGKPYPGGEVIPVQYEREEPLAVNRKIVELTRRIYKTLHIDRELPMDLTAFRTYDLAHYIGFTLEQEYTFLTLSSARERQEFMLAHLQQVRPDAAKQARMEARAKLNGHFQQLSSPDF